MPGNAFIRFAKPNNGGWACPGESSQTSNPASAGWLTLTDWSWDVESETNFQKISGASVGRAQPGTLSITHHFDASSAPIMQNIVMGTNFQTIEIQMLKQTGDATGKPAVYFQLIAGYAFVSKVSSKYGEDGTCTQDVDFVCKEIAIGYKPQSNVDGSLKATSTFGWNIAKMNMTPLTATVTI